MQIAASALFLALAIHLDSVDSEGSEPNSLEDLFSGYNGVMPPLRGFWSLNCNIRNSTNFRTFDQEPLYFESGVLLRRDHIIIGCLGWQNIIRNPRLLSSNLKNVYIVFDMNEKRWITLPYEIIRELGVGRRYPFVKARDEVAATHRLKSNDPVYKKAHMRACRQANAQADTVEKEQEDLLCSNQTTFEDTIGALKESYDKTYDRAFSLHLYQHGEYNINGHRESYAREDV